MSSSIAFLPVTQSQKHSFNFKELSKLVTSFVEQASKAIAELPSSELTEENIGEELVKVIESVYKVEESSGNTSKSSAPKAKRPKQALSSYIYFCKDQRTVMKEENPDADPKEITSLLAEKWSNLTDDEKKPYVKLHDEEVELLKQQRESGVSSDDEVKKPATSKAKSSSAKKEATTEKKAPADKKPADKKPVAAPKAPLVTVDDDENDEEPILQPVKKAPVATKAKK